MNNTGAIKSGTHGRRPQWAQLPPNITRHHLSISAINETCFIDASFIFGGGRVFFVPFSFVCVLEDRNKNTNVKLERSRNKKKV